MQRKGDLPSILITIVIISVLGIMLFLFSSVFMNLYTGLDSYFDESPRYNNSEAHMVVNDVILYETSMWDYVFLAITLGYILTLFISSFSTPTDAVFYWIYGFVLLFGLVIGAILSNVWQGIADTPSLAATTARFPITDAILGNFYPLFILIFAVTSMILLFGKSSGGNR